MESLESRLTGLVDELTLAGDWMDRYRLLVQWGEESESLPEAQLRAEFEVSGCSSPLWLRVTKSNGKLEVRGSSPGLLPKALVALLIRLFDGLEVVHGTAAAIVDRLDMRGNLSPTRLLVFERMLNRVLNGGP